jgi:diguanylate cyclase (GGDEF)-like protein
MTLIRLWWRQPDRYDQLMAHLQSRGIVGRARLAIAATGALMTSIAFAMIWSSTGPRGIVATVCVLVATAGGASGAVLWSIRMPTRAQSVRFAVVINLSIALVVVAQSDPLAALLGATMFAGSSVYVAVAHTAPLLTFCFTVTTATAIFEAVRCTPKYGLTEALCAYGTVIVISVGLPILMQMIVRVLGVDALRSQRDQLTGLLNRGAFRGRAAAFLHETGDRLDDVALALLDLDRFKQLNDRYGHSTGDDALAAVAATLRVCTNDSAIIGRIGGEEFAILDSWQPDEVNSCARMLCAAIGALPFEITASIGIAVPRPDRRVPVDDPKKLVIELIEAADAAMYVAKRRGGNQIQAASNAPPA